MRFNWGRFLDKHGISWVEGPAKNVAAGKIGINCPWCATDTGNHLGIDPVDGYYTCWKDASHRGSKPYYLIQTLARCSKKEAIELYESLSSSSGVDLRELEMLLDEEPKKETYSPCEYTGNEFLLKDTKASEKFLTYLEERGFEDPLAVAKEYQLRGAISGPFEDRVIFPFTIENDLVGWTGRSILKNTKYRYKTFPHGKGSNASKIVYNYDKCRDARVLCLVEGPFDALKLDAYGAICGVRAVATLGLSLGPSKIRLLQRLITNNTKLVIMLDAAALSNALQFKEQLSSVTPNCEVFEFDLAKDPGDLTKQQVQVLSNLLISRQ